MKAKTNVSYFPVSTDEQVLLLRVREPDLAGRADDILAMLAQIAEAKLTPAELDQAVQLLAESRQGEGLDARFDNLEARLKERIERGLAEIEGRLSKRLAGDAPTPEHAPVASVCLPVAQPQHAPSLPFLARAVPRRHTRGSQRGFPSRQRARVGRECRAVLRRRLAVAIRPRVRWAGRSTHPGWQEAIRRLYLACASQREGIHPS